jgi:hypothetical protein
VVKEPQRTQGITPFFVSFVVKRTTKGTRYHALFVSFVVKEPQRAQGITPFFVSFVVKRTTKGTRHHTLFVVFFNGPVSAGP